MPDPTPTPTQNIAPPIRTPMVDPKTGLVTQPWALFFDQMARKVNA